jgi:hypothetical protein
MEPGVAPFMSSSFIFLRGEIVTREIWCAAGLLHVTTVIGQLLYADCCLDIWHFLFKPLLCASTAQRPCLSRQGCTACWEHSNFRFKIGHKIWLLSQE